MGIMKKVAGFVSGGLFKEIKETVMAYLPPDMSPQAKAEYQLKVTEALNRKQLRTAEIMNKAAAQLDRRIAEQEGTAGDLLKLPVIGRLVLFIRGCQRPAWGFFVMFADLMWYGGAWEFEEGGTKAMSLLLVNLLVLGFLFGERTIQNLQPLVLRIVDKIFGTKS